MKVLLVEDNESVAGFVRKGLSEAGHVVDHAANGRDGMFFAASECYDAIVMDRMLPGGIDGLTIVAALRRDGNKTPILILSALSEVDERIRGTPERRRRLSREAVRLRRAARASRCPAAT